jgi:hypothetical protein
VCCESSWSRSVYALYHTLAQPLPFTIRRFFFPREASQTLATRRVSVTHDHTHGRERQDADGTTRSTNRDTHNANIKPEVGVANQ